MQYKAGDTVWYRGQFGHFDYEGLIRGLADHQSDASEPIYVLTTPRHRMLNTYLQ